jgi:hypothetical protein
MPPQVWNLQSNLIYPSNDQVAFYTDLVSEVNAKAATGFPIQIVGSTSRRRVETVRVLFMTNARDMLCTCTSDRLLGTRSGRPPPTHAVPAQHVAKLYVR